MRSVLLKLLAGAVILAGCSEQPKRETWATVVNTAPNENPKWNPDDVVVKVRSRDGILGTKSIQQSRLDCRVGDTVRASVRGLALTLDDRACVR